MIICDLIRKVFTIKSYNFLFCNPLTFVIYYHTNKCCILMRHIKPIPIPIWYLFHEITEIICLFSDLIGWIKWTIISAIHIYYARIALTLWIRIPLKRGYSIQHYVIKFVSDLRQVGGFFSGIPVPPPIKLTATI